MAQPFIWYVSNHMRAESPNVVYPEECLAKERRTRKKVDRSGKMRHDQDLQCGFLSPHQWLLLVLRDCRRHIRRNGSNGCWPSGGWRPARQKIRFRVKEPDLLRAPVPFRKGARASARQARADGAGAPFAKAAQRPLAGRSEDGPQWPRR